MRELIHRPIFILIIASTCIYTITAQQNITAASISGFVSDSNGALIAGANVGLRNVQTNQLLSATTGTDGRFRFAYVPVGPYEVRAEHEGFLPVARRVELSIGQVIDMPLYLGVGEISATVDVVDQGGMIERTRTQVTSAILPNDIDELPLNGRNFLDLALLLPGVSKTNLGRNQRFAETSAISGAGISVAGQRNLNNSFIVDGTGSNDDAASLAATAYSQEVIREFQVVASGGSAEFGRASSGFVNILTKSGTNDLHTSFYGFIRDERFDARNPLAKDKDPLTQAQYGGSVSGRLIKDRTFYFANFEQTRRNDASLVTITSANVVSINERLASIGYSGEPIKSGLVGSGYDTTNFFGKADHQINSRNSLTASYSFYGNDAVNSRTVGGLNAASRGSGIDNQDHSLNVQNVTVVGSNSVNELRGLYRRSRLAAPVNDLIGPAVNISGIASFGTATFSPTRRDIDVFEISDSFSSRIGSHSVKFGGSFLFNRIDIEFPGAVRGVYTFTSLPSFLSGNYSQFQQAFGSPSQLQNNPNYGLFIQDEWRIRRDLIFNIGVRFDIQDLPDPIDTDTDNIAPRFGFAYSPGAKTVVRGSFGLFYDRVPLRATSNALQRDGSKYVTAIILPDSPDAPIFPNLLARQPNRLGTRPSVTRIDPNIESGLSHQANLQIEHELPFDTTVSAGYIYLRGLHLILSRNVNVPTCSDATANLCRPDPEFGNISRYEGSGDSAYHGLVLSLNRRDGKWGNTRVSYTLSKAIDNVGNFFFSSPQNNFDLRDDRGRSDNDQRHRLTVSGSLRDPEDARSSLPGRLFRGITLSYIFTYASAPPFNIQAGADLNHDTNNNDRPLGIGRNTGRGFDFASVDLRLSRLIRFGDRWSLELLAEGFNILNRSNYSVPNNIFGTNQAPRPGFGIPTVALDARQFQFGMKFSM